jgi:hypothetical protein
VKKLLLVSSLFAFGAFAGEWKGTISDAKCGAAHADASEKSMACAKGCVKKGMAPVFVSDGKVLKISNADKVADLVGQKVTITGKMDGDTVTVDTIAAATE